MSPPFPTVLVINLDQRTDRWASMTAQCAAAEISPVRVPAVAASPGWRGCGLSHMLCLRMATALPWVLILEDDATFTPAAITRFRKLLPYLWDQRGDWGRFNGGPTFEANPPLRVLDREQPIIEANGFCLHFSLVHQGAYAQILEWNPDRDREIDVYLRKIHGEKFRNVATYPHIAEQGGSASDITPGIDMSSLFRYSSQCLRACLVA